MFGLGIGFALVSLLSYVVTMPDFVTSMVAMIGLGVGIDYALFIVTRYREGLRLGLSVEESVVEAMDTSGRAVLFAGITVIISLMGLTVIGLSFVTGMAVAASIGVLMMILGSLTLLPALLGWVGTRIDNTSRAALIAVGDRRRLLARRLLRRRARAVPRRGSGWRSSSLPSPSPSSRCASWCRTAPSSPRSGASGTAGVASSSVVRGRACSAPPVC